MSVIAFGRDGGKKTAQIWGEANTYIFSYIADCRRIRRISELARDHRLLFYIFSSTPSTQTTFSTANPTPKSLHESVNHFFLNGKGNATQLTLIFTLITLTRSHLSPPLLIAAVAVAALLVLARVSAVLVARVVG